MLLLRSENNELTYASALCVVKNLGICAMVLTGRMLPVVCATNKNGSGLSCHTPGGGAWVIGPCGLGVGWLNADALDLAAGNDVGLALGGT